VWTNGTVCLSTEGTECIWTEDVECVLTDGTGCLWTEVKFVWTKGKVFCRLWVQSVCGLMVQRVCGLR